MTCLPHSLPGVVDNIPKGMFLEREHVKTDIFNVIKFSFTKAFRCPVQNQNQTPKSDPDEL